MKLTALDSPNRSLNCVNIRPFVRTSRISCTLRPCKHSCVNIHREEHLTLRTLMVSIRTCTDAATKDVPCKLRKYDSEVSGTCVTWCEKLPSWGSMILLFGTEILSTQLQPSYFYLQGCPNFARNPASPPQGMQPSQPLAITREHSDRSQRGYANLKRATPRDQMISDSFRKATPLKRTEFHAQDCWVGAFQFFLEAKLVCKNQSGTITRLINGQ